MDGEQCIHVALHRRDALLGKARLARTLERERQRHDADRQDAEVFRNLRDRRDSTRTRAAAEAARDEDDVRARDGVLDFRLVRLGSRLADGRIAARAASLRDLFANLQARDAQVLEQGELPCLRVDCNELDVLDVLRMDEVALSHALEDVVAAAADADHLDRHARPLQRCIVCHHKTRPLSVRHKSSTLFYTKMGNPATHPKK